MKKNIIYKSAMISAVIGLIMIFIVILSGTAYPHMLFRIGTPLGLAFIFASVILLFISWLWEIRNGIKRKQYVQAIVIAILGLVVIIQTIIKIR